MSTNLQAALALANQEAEESGVDLNEAVKGGSSRLLPAGYAFGRLVEYIELGMQPQEFGGKPKDPALDISLGFALWGQNATGETYHDAATGEPYVIRPYSMALSRNEKSRAFKLFKAMNWKGTSKNFAQLLGQAFLVKIVHEAKSKTDTTIVSRIDFAGFLPPLDPVTQQPYPVPEGKDSLYRLFLWNRPTKAAWDSLFIEGTYEAKDGKPAASKNRIQETILKALDFQGSALQNLLGGAQSLIAPTVTAAAPQVAAPSVSVAVTAPGALVVPPTGPAGIVAPPAVPSSTPSVPASTATIASPSSIPTVAPAITAVPAVASIPSVPSLPSLPA